MFPDIMFTTKRPWNVERLESHPASRLMAMLAETSGVGRSRMLYVCFDAGRCEVDFAAPTDESKIGQMRSRIGGWMPTRAELIWRR